MSDLVASWSGGPWYGVRRPWQDQVRERWTRTPPRARTAVQLTLLLAAVVGAYNYSLLTLVQSAGLETPLAYVSLVPVIALGLAFVRRQPRRREPAIHDRQVDYIVGVPLVVFAMAVNLWLPHKFSAMFWVWRLDLFSLPFFVAGAVAIVFGTRVLWRQKLAIGYLMLAWPLPYTLVLLRLLNAFTNLTLVGLHVLLRIVPVATPASGADNSIFSVTHAGHAFPLSVVSACSGINGIVGFLLVGVAFGAIVNGPLVRKALWLSGGMVLLWLTNLGRLLFIFWAGRLWGEHVAIDILHPFVGLVTFSLGVLVMVLVLGPIGLRIGGSPAAVATTPAGRHLTRATARAVPKLFAAAVVVVAAALVVGTSDMALRSYNLVADASGEPKLTAYRSVPVAPDGWRPRLDAVYDWAKPLFGADSTWYRYVLSSAGGEELAANYAVTLDVVDSGDLQSFSAYGVEACYQFHGYALRDVAEVKLVGGITGQALSYSSGANQSWSILYWIVPVKAGEAIRYERMVLYLLNAPGGNQVQLPNGTKISELAGGLGSSRVDRGLAANRAFLVAFGDELLDAEASPGAHLVGSGPASSPADTISGVGQSPAGVGPPKPITPLVRSVAGVSLPPSG